MMHGPLDCSVPCIPLNFLVFLLFVLCWLFLVICTSCIFRTKTVLGPDLPSPGPERIPDRQLSKM